MSDNRNERLPPLSNDEWFERHVVPHINNIEKGPDDHYHLAVVLCWNRHKYVDDYAGTVELAAFPKMCITPQKWAPNFAHAVRFWKTLRSEARHIQRRKRAACRYTLVPFGCEWAK